MNNIGTARVPATASDANTTAQGDSERKEDEDKGDGEDEGTEEGDTEGVTMMRDKWRFLTPTNRTAKRRSRLLGTWREDDR